MLKTLIALLLVAVVISLFSGLFFLVKDENNSKRLAHSLTIRVALAAIFIFVVLIALWTGELTLNPSPV